MKMNLFKGEAEGERVTFVRSTEEDRQEQEENSEGWSHFQ